MFKKIKIKELPAECYFWRRYNTFRWQYLSDCSGIPLDIFEIDHELIQLNPEEEVIIHPYHCDNCLQPLNSWPPPAKCPHCNVINESRISLKTMKAEIKNWTGNLDPHLG